MASPCSERCLTSFRVHNDVEGTPLASARGGALRRVPPPPRPPRLLAGSAEDSETRRGSHPVPRPRRRRTLCLRSFINELFVLEDELWLQKVHFALH